MTTVQDRPRARSARSSGRDFHTELGECCELALTRHARMPSPADPAMRTVAAAALQIAAQAVAAHGMSLRHDAARQLIAGQLGVYDRFFRLPAAWRPAPAAPGSPLTWRNRAGEVVIDMVRTAPPSHPLVDAATRARLTAVATWAQQSGGDIAGVRILSMAAPSDSLLHQPSTGFTPLAETTFGTRLAADPTPGTMVDVAIACHMIAVAGSGVGAEVAR